MLSSSNFQNNLYFSYESKYMEWSNPLGRSKLVAKTIKKFDKKNSLRDCSMFGISPRSLVCVSEAFGRISTSYLWFIVNNSTEWMHGNNISKEIAAHVVTRELAIQGVEADCR